MNLWIILCYLLEQLVSDGERFRLLHAVVSRSLPLVTVQLACRQHPEQNRERDATGSTPLHLACGKPAPCSATVECLLRTCPAAARIENAEGRLPIDLAAEHAAQWTGAILLLLEAEPRAVCTRDKRDRFFPFMTAAVGETRELSTIYALLRAKPHVLSYLQLK
jgi:hypothetical protein